MNVNGSRNFSFWCRIASVWSLAIVLLSVGCQSRDAQRLVGQWELVDPRALAERVNQSDEAATSSPSEERFSALGNGMVVEFTSRGILTTHTQLGAIRRDKSGTWRVLATEPNQNLTRVAYSLAGDSGELSIEWIDNDTMKMVPPNMAGLSMKLTFRRRK